MIEDLFTLPSARRQGVITSVIAAFADLRANGCHTVSFSARLLTIDPNGSTRAWAFAQ